MNGKRAGLLLLYKEDNLFSINNNFGVSLQLLNDSWRKFLFLFIFCDRRQLFEIIEEPSKV